MTATPTAPAFPAWATTASTYVDGTLYCRHDSTVVEGAFLGQPIDITGSGFGAVEDPYIVVPFPTDGGSELGCITPAVARQVVAGLQELLSLLNEATA